MRLAIVMCWYILTKSRGYILPLAQVWKCFIYTHTFTRWEQSSSSSPVSYPLHTDISITGTSCCNGEYIGLSLIRVLKACWYWQNIYNKPQMFLHPLNYSSHKSPFLQTGQIISKLRMSHHIIWDNFQP